MRRRAAASAFALGLALAGCGGGGPARPPCAAGKVCLEFGNTADPTSIDPQKISLTTESQVVGDLMVGLVEDGPDGRPTSGVATSWTTSPDGLVWIFRLRRSQWSDGEPVTADDFVFALRRMLDPKTASPYAYLLYLLQNGEAINEGRAAPETLGARALDPFTLQLTLSHPAPYLLQIAKHSSMYPLPRHVVDRWGDAWARPEHYVSNGPFRPVSWVIGDHLRVVKNPRFYDAAHVCVDRIDYYPTNDAVSAERRVRSGELDVNTTILSNRVAYLRQPGRMPAYVRIHPFLAVTYLPFNSQGTPALRDRRVRQALSMAIDRDFITGKLLRAGQQSAYAFVPPGVDNYVVGPHAVWADWPLERRQGAARRLLADAGYGPGHPLSIELKFPNSSDAMLITPAVQADWKSIGVRTTLAQNEAQIAYEAFRNKDFDVGLASWVADYDDPSTFLGLMQSQTGAQNYGGYANRAYDALLARADQEPDARRRAQILASAEQAMLDDAPVAPLYFTVNRNLVTPRITGWVDNRADIHRSRYLCFKH